jgi:hypothetical protein
LYFLPNIIVVFKEDEMSGACGGKEMHTSVLVVKPEGNNH